MPTPPRWSASVIIDVLTGCRDKLRHRAGGEVPVIKKRIELDQIERATEMRSNFDSYEV